MAHMKVKGSNARKGTGKWRKILAIAKGKMSLTWDAESRWTSIMERIKWEGKSIVRCSRREQKLSTRLGDGVIMKEKMEYKGHQHAQKPQAFCKGRTINELALTLFGRTLTKSRFELILGHSPQMLITGIIKKLYPRNPKYIRNKLRCDRNACTSNASKEKRYWMINPVHVGVKLLDKHERTSDRDVIQRLPSPTVNDSRKVGVGEVHQNDLVFKIESSNSVKYTLNV